MTMTGDISIRAENISKVYRLYDNPVDRLKESFHPLRKKYHRDFYALKDINFEVKKGETVGIIGKNGSGKSTLLKILSGVLTPSAGRVIANGKISALLELGTGFNPELTGIENIYLSGTIMGYSREQMDAKLHDILAFADIGEFVYQPVKTYSSGMFVRLAFAVAITVDPEILIVDEALAVGDIRFSQKCYRKIRQFKDNNKTILMVTHDTGAVINFCSRAIWMQNGEIVKNDTPDHVVKDYVSYMAYDSVSTHSKKTEDSLKDKDAIPWEDVAKCYSFGEGGAEIRKVALCNGHCSKNEVYKGGETVKFLVDIQVKREIAMPIIGFVLNDEYGNHITGLNTLLAGNCLRSFHKGEKIVAEFEFSFPYLRNGKYTLSSAIAEGTLQNHIQHHWVHDSCIFEIVNKNESAGAGWYFILKDAKINIQ